MNNGKCLLIVLFLLPARAFGMEAAQSSQQCKDRSAVITGHSNCSCDGCRWYFALSKVCQLCKKPHPAADFVGLSCCGQSNYCNECLLNLLRKAFSNRNVQSLHCQECNNRFSPYDISNIIRNDIKLQEEYKAYGQILEGRLAFFKILNSGVTAQLHE